MVGLRNCTARPWVSAILGVLLVGSPIFGLMIHASHLLPLVDPSPQALSSGQISGLPVSEAGLAAAQESSVSLGHDFVHCNCCSAHRQDKLLPQVSFLPRVSRLKLRPLHFEDVSLASRFIASLYSNRAPPLS